MAVTGGLNKMVQASTAPGLTAAGQLATPGVSSRTSAPEYNSQAIAAAGVTITAGSAQNVTLDGGNKQKSVAAADMSNTLIVDSRGDMIELELKIIGDPHFIKQDDIFYSRPRVGESVQLTPNKSLYMDTGELYIFVNFLSPVDYDEQKGLAEVKANEKLGKERSGSLGYSNFSGVYKLITVDSVFSRGKFEQTLRMAKILYDQFGKSIVDERLEQRQTLSLSVAPRPGFIEGVGAEFQSDVNSVSAFLQNNTGINIEGRIIDFSDNSITQATVPSSITLSASDEGISTSTQTSTQSTSAPVPVILKANWSVDSTALG
jgi:hypothetical protein